MAARMSAWGSASPSHWELSRQVESTNPSCRQARKVFSQSADDAIQLGVAGHQRACHHQGIGRGAGMETHAQGGRDRPGEQEEQVTPAAQGKGLPRFGCRRADESESVSRTRQ